MHFTLKGKIVGGPHDGLYCTLEMDTDLPIEDAFDKMTFAEMAGGKYAIQYFDQPSMTAEFRFLSAIPSTSG